MSDFWKQTFCHFLPGEYLRSTGSSEFIDALFAVLTFMLAALLLIVLYLPWACYKAFAPQRMVRRFKATREGE